MAKTPVSLIVSDFVHKKREVASFRMAFNQATDAEGQVTDVPHGGKITLRVKALNDGNTDLVRWMTDVQKSLSGKIVFEDSTSGKQMKTVNFIDAYCVNYVESWEDSVSDVDLAHWEEITISCREIKIGAMELFKNTWELVL
jgi:hypothetical protein